MAPFGQVQNNGITGQQVVASRLGLCQIVHRVLNHHDKGLGLGQIASITHREWNPQDDRRQLGRQHYHRRHRPTGPQHAGGVPLYKSAT